MPSDEQTEAETEILSRIRERSPGWRDLLSTLLHRYHRPLLNRCLLYLKNRQDAEDATQETEIRAFRAIRQFRGEAGFRTWLFAIADRQCHDQARRRARHLMSEHIRSLIEIHEASQSGEAAPAESRDLVRQVLAQLPRRDREVLELRFYSDLSFQDMSRHLDLGLSATKMRHYRALELFDRMLRTEAPGH